MRFTFFFLSALALSSCQQPQLPEELRRHTQVVNAGMEELINEKLSRLSMIAAETGKLKQTSDYAQFYYKNTFYLIDQNTEEPDSLIFWRLTQSKEAHHLGFQPDLDSAIIFGEDSLMRKTALLSNLHEYAVQINSSYGYCGILYGCIPVRDAQDSSKIYLHGVPPKGSVLSTLAEYAYELTSSAQDTMPVWGTLTINPINNSTN